MRKSKMIRGWDPENKTSLKIYSLELGLLFPKFHQKIAQF